MYLIDLEELIDPVELVHPILLIESIDLIIELVDRQEFKPWQ